MCVRGEVRSFMADAAGGGAPLSESGFSGLAGFSGFRFALSFPLSTPVIPALYPVIPALYPVIPAKAGIQMVEAKLATRNQA